MSDGIEPIFIDGPLAGGRHVVSVAALYDGCKYIAMFTEPAEPAEPARISWRPRTVTYCFQRFVLLGHEIWFGSVSTDGAEDLREPELWDLLVSDRAKAAAISIDH